MVVPPSGFKEIPHTADWELEVWAPDFPALLEQAARGMYWLAKIHLASGPPVSRTLEIPLEDVESILVRFLEELLYLSEVEGLGFDIINIGSDQETLHVQLIGAPLARQSKEIKAVTYHNLAVRQTDRGLEANIVFDV